MSSTRKRDRITRSLNSAREKAASFLPIPNFKSGSAKKSKNDGKEASGHTSVSDTDTASVITTEELLSLPGSTPSISMSPQTTHLSGRGEGSSGSHSAAMSDNTSHPADQVHDVSAVPVLPRVRIVEERLNALRNPTSVNDGVSQAPTAEDWELDRNFLVALETWNHNHPSDTLDHVLKKVNSAIQKGKPFFDLIPDAPFPAKSVVKSLAQLFELGAQLSGANLKALDFALDISEWFSNLHMLIRSLENDDQRKLVWNNLAKFRQVLDEICTWTVTRLDDNRWSPRSKFDVEDEIAGFKMHLNEARQIFHDHSLIRISGDIHSVLLTIRGFQDGQDRILNMLKKIVVARKAQEDKIAAEKARQEYLHRVLDPRTVSQSSYDQQEKMPCAQDTRVEVLHKIHRWINDHSGTSQNFLWLTGDPGCGKSAITATIAREAKDKNFLWAQFFINRNLDDTTNPNKYFPTIARQLSDHSEVVEHQIYDRVKEKPSVLDAMTSYQAAELFINAIAKASTLHREEPVLIVIDGLDETDRFRLRDTAEIFSRLFEGLSHHPNAKILISSRTEDKIHQPFTETLTTQHVKHLHLRTADSRDDVGRFIEDRLRTIAQKHRFDPDRWPGDECLDHLQDRASGLFIWAVTFIKFLDAQIELRNERDINKVLNNLKPVPGTKDDIYYLYGRILQLTHDPLCPDNVDFENFRLLVGLIIVAREPLSIAYLCRLLGIYLGASVKMDEGFIRQFVRRLRTILVSGLDEVNDKTFLRVHKSFFEYITGKNAEERFRIDLESANAEMTLCCLLHLADSYTIVQNAQFVSGAMNVTTLPYPVQYALRFCLSHVPRRDGHVLGTVFDDSVATLSQFRSLLSRSSNLSRMGPLHYHYHDKSPFLTTTLDAHSLIWNATDYSPTTPVLLKHDSRAIRLGPSPDGSHFAIADFAHNAITLCESQTFKVIRKVAVPKLSCIAFSADGAMIASGCTDGTIGIWNGADEHPCQSLEAVHDSQEAILCISFTPDGIHLITGGSDCAIKVWNVHTNTLVERPPMEHSDWVRSITISSTGAWILSASSDRSLCLWDFRTGSRIGDPFTGHTGSVVSAAISPNLDCFVSGSWDATVRLWDAHTHKQVGDPWRGHSVYSIDLVAFLPDGKHILSGGRDGVRLWMVPTGQALGFFVLPDSIDSLSPSTFSSNGQQIFYPVSHGIAMANIPSSSFIQRTFSAQWSAFSTPKGNLVISSGADDTLLLSNLGLTTTVGLPLKGDGSPFRCVAFSPDERLVAGASIHGVVYLWAAMDRSLISTYQLDHTQEQISLSFTHGGTVIVVVAGTNQTLLELVNGRLTVSDNLSTQNQLAQFFSTSPNQSIQHGSQLMLNRYPSKVQWFSNNSDTNVLWALIKNHLIRAGSDGKFVILPVSNCISPEC